jgi:hypothetical protein
MNSLTDLRDVVDVVIGVETHVHTHSAAAIDTGTGGVLGEITVDATAESYAQLVQFANDYVTLRAWAIEGTGGHGPGWSRHLAEMSEIVIELERPKRAARRNGAKSHPLDAIRRYRLNRYGDRHLNRALHTVVQVRMQYRQPPATTSPAAQLKERPAARSTLPHPLRRRRPLPAPRKWGASCLTKHGSVVAVNALFATIAERVTTGSFYLYPMRVGRQRGPQRSRPSTCRAVCA